MDIKEYCAAVKMSPEILADFLAVDHDTFQRYINIMGWSGRKSFDIHHAGICAKHLRHDLWYTWVLDKGVFGAYRDYIGESIEYHLPETY